MAEGLDLTLDSKIGDTRNAHCLAELAKAKDGLQTIIADQLYQAYSEASADITEPVMLQRIGVAAGLDAKVVRDWIESDKGGEEVDRQAESAKEGPGWVVPRYVIQDIYTLDGADDPSAIFEVSSQIKCREPES